MNETGGIAATDSGADRDLRAPAIILLAILAALLGVSIFNLVDGRIGVGFGGLAIVFALAPLAWIGFKRSG